MNGVLTRSPAEPGAALGRVAAQGAYTTKLNLPMHAAAVHRRTRRPVATVSGRTNVNNFKRILPKNTILEYF